MEGKKEGKGKRGVGGEVRCEADPTYVCNCIDTRYIRRMYTVM